MKNILRKFSPLALVALAVMALSGCAADDEDFTPGELDNGAYLYASSTNLTYTPDDEQVLTLNVGRMDSTQAQTINLTSDNDAFQVPSSVSFAAGQSSTTLSIPFNMEIGETDTLTIKLSKENASNYGADSLTFIVMRDYNWDAAGEGEFSETGFGLSATGVPVQHARGTNIYRLVRPFYYACQQAGETTLPTGGNIQFTLSNTGEFQLADGIYSIDDSGKELPYQMYYDNGNYSQYCNISQDGKTITVNYFLLKDKKLHGPVSFTFDWTTGYPYSTAAE